jgi:hypothetical protein
MVEPSEGLAIAGQAVQGSVVIRGQADTVGFQSYEVDFSYTDNPTQTWFLIQERGEVKPDGTMVLPTIFDEIEDIRNYMESLSRQM